MNSNPRCKGQTKTGKPCRTAAASAGKCLFHANPNKNLVPCETPWRANFIAPGPATPLHLQPCAVEATDLERLT